MTHLGTLRELERRIIRLRWWGAGTVLFSLIIATLCAVNGFTFGTAINFFAAAVNGASFHRNGRQLTKVRETILMFGAFGETSE